MENSEVLSQPAISVIIPMYNTEEYVGECLDSLLIQTFQDFEVIIVDDCSADNSVKIVENYVPKFDGRLKFSKTEKNSGGGGYVPRNIGLELASGEYVFFLDSDDFILGSALETLYNAAKQYDADVVYTGSHYELKSSTNFFLHRDGEGKRLLREGQEDETKLILDDSSKLLSLLLLEEREGNFRTSWTKFIRRSLLIENKIVFPNLSNAGDFIWVINVYCYAKRFLRISSPLYFYRRYNTTSVTQKRREPTEQISNWISAFIGFVKNLSELESKIEILSKNPAYCFGAFKSHFEWCLTCTNYAREKLSDKDIYEALHRKFIKDFPDSAIPFFFSFFSNERKISNDNLKTIKKLEKEIAQFKNSSACPAVSVIIPLYNAETYIGECLDSLLKQTFQNFEVIVVDDCSTDNSVNIVKSYAPKFDGRLKFSKTEKNSGGGGIPRNKGLAFSRGEYIQFLDADDMLTKTALEEVYALAKKYNADVIYCEKYYMANSDGTNIRIHTYQKGTLIKQPTLESNDYKEKIQRIIDERYMTIPWNKLVKRNLIMDNEIFFPNLKTSEDNIWTQGLIFYAKKILRIPNTVYIYRQSPNSSQRTTRTPQQVVNFWLNPVLLGLKSLDDMMSRNEFFLTNPACRYAVLKNFINVKYKFTLSSVQKLAEEEVYSTIKNEFGEKLGVYDVLIPALCTILYDEKKSYLEEMHSETSIYREFIDYLISDIALQHFTARVDAKFESPEQGDFQIVSVSDDKVEISKPLWFQKNGVGYIIQSNVGKLEVIAKATSKGQLNFNLKGISVFDTKDKTKRIPYWVGYTKFVVNGDVIFDTLIPTWHDKSYRYNMNIKADKEIKIQIEWFTRKSDTIEQKVLPPLPKVEKLIPNKFEPYLTARIDAKFSSKVSYSDFQILSISDEKAKVLNPEWFQHNGIGYVITSLNGELKIVVKATADGQITFKLRGMDVRTPENWKKAMTERIPYWIDYTKFTINDKTIFNKITPAWCDKPYSYTIEVKAGEEIEIQVEWLPHRSDL